MFSTKVHNRNKLVFVPDWSIHNPYQKLLYDEMKAAGISCYGLQGTDFTFSWIFKNRLNFKFIHLHWLHGIYNLHNSGLYWANLMTIALKIIFARLIGYNILWTIHNIVPHDTANYNFEMISRKIISKIVNIIIVHCDYARNTVTKLWAIDSKKVKVVPHGSYIGYYPNNISRSYARQILNISDDQFTFLFFGLLRPYKGIKDLLISYSEVRKLKHNISLIIAGNPHNEIIRNEVESMAITEGISLHLRHIQDNDVQLFFNACDIVVLPYLKFLTSGAAILALSFGKPVIAPAKACIPELLDETTGFLYQKQSELTMVMKKAATNAADISQFSNNALNRAQELEWKKIVTDIFIPILKEL